MFDNNYIEFIISYKCRAGAGGRSLKIPVSLEVIISYKTYSKGLHINEVTGRECFKLIFIWQTFFI